jgi:HAD superfamily hydrolase (TIGR01509 family)
LSHTLAAVMPAGDPIRGVCFDLDGTLVDTEHLQWQAYRRVLGEHGVDIDLDEYRRRFIAVEGGAEWACRHWRLPFDATALRARKAVVYRELIAGGVAAMPGARACLERLHGACRLAVVTNSTRAEAATVLAPLDVAGLLDAIVAREDYAAAKPAPDAYRAAAAAIGCAPAACVAIEDTPRGVRAARAAGMWVVAVPSDLTADQDFAGAALRLATLDALTPALLRTLEDDR